MKGTILLIPIEKVEEGMKVCYPFIVKYDIHTVGKIVKDIIFLYDKTGSISVENAHREELKQLVIQYETSPAGYLNPYPLDSETKQLPILQSQWKEILDKGLIGKEVEFFIEDYHKTERIQGNKLGPIVQLAKVILPDKEQSTLKIETEDKLYSKEDLKHAYNMGASNQQQQDAGLESMIDFEDWFIYFNKRK